jgi:hypothetical protein
MLAACPTPGRPIHNLRTSRLTQCQVPMCRPSLICHRIRRRRRKCERDWLLRGSCLAIYAELPASLSSTWSMLLDNVASPWLSNCSAIAEFVSPVQDRGCPSAVFALT